MNRILRAAVICINFMGTLLNKKGAFCGDHALRSVCRLLSATKLFVGIISKNCAENAIFVKIDISESDVLRKSVKKFLVVLSKFLERYDRNSVHMTAKCRQSHQ